MTFSSNPKSQIRNPKYLLGLSAMVLITAIWGWSFLLVKDAVTGYPVFPFLALRFTLATLIVAPFLIRRLLRAGLPALIGGFWMGVALFSGYAFQTMGLTFTSAAHGGFITGLFVVLTPLFEATLSRRLAPLTAWIAVGLATSGLFILSWEGSFSEVNPGDLLSLACAGVYAVHLLVTSRMAGKYDTGALVLGQLMTVSALAWLFSIPDLGRVAPVPAATTLGIVATALLATALAYYVQTAFQRHTSAIQTAVVFTLEPVFAGLFAVLLGGERLGIKGITGGVLIVAGMFVGQVAEGKSKPSTEPV